MSKEKLIRKFDKQARIYEMRRRKGSEKEWREKLIRNAQGHVLEVGVGAGANFPFYSPRVHVTAVDFSKEMLSKAEQSAAEHGIHATFIRSDTETVSFPDDSFDTIVSTLTLCGYQDPLVVLNYFRRWCKNEGRILLMEHGISSNRLVGSLQRFFDPLSLKMVGCHQNRAILQLLEKANVKIEKIERHMLGAVYLIWASPNKSTMKHVD